jgi:predicted phage-related endonuclease
MAIERTQIDLLAKPGRERWLKLRDPDVTASVIGALFSCHPYKTALRLYAEKRGAEFPEEPESRVLRRGRKLEPVVAADVAELRPNWQLTKATEYLRDPELRLGATPDYYAVDERGRRGVVQIKTALPHIIERDWRGGTEPPLWILLQASTEMLLDDAAFAAVAVLDVGDYETKIFDLPREPGVEAKIVAGVARFWQQVEQGIEPEPDYGRDRSTLRALHPRHEPGEVADLRERNDIPVLLDERTAKKKEIKEREARIEEIETQLIKHIGEAERALVHGFSITYKSVHYNGYSVEPRDTRVLRIITEKGTNANG